ncbi:SagB/ThcOx family dehydrogenase [Legionella taurinensis]|uniref:SagB/ThcOx family dehydrogenase n=1 Tax=Legionella taurinensis TaxID=70611 RepID=A0A3A5L1G8_9GAMM|nr:SagB/ThcOx family dehydrogenase [Legionella taurinensis]RJT44205.1 SagB/ThcOx family dehydrogenase [Legionella taurinensis]RJT67106.1 SagB/ThcOx family dehydrogenase [Legionella taurinensis]STY26403.1 putative nitroreductase [Legionella taurinensis]
MSATFKKPFISGLVEGHLDAQVYQDILKTHAKESITMLDFGNLAITNVDQRAISRVQFTECEISPFHHHDVACQTPEEALFSREASTTRFAQKAVDFPLIETLLIHSFSPNDSNHRPYPSAGGLYPVEPLVFLFEERLTHSASVTSGAYHFRPISNTLQRIKTLSSAVFFEQLLHGLMTPESCPAFAVLYIAHIGKALFKYRYRGYRHAVMEAGSMYQQALHTAQTLGLRSTVWSSFSDHQLMHALDLDPTVYLPLTMQLFGYGASND